MRSSPTPAAAAEPLLDVAALEQPALARRRAPHAGVAVGLQLEPHRQVVLELRALRLELPHARLGAELLLQVVADLVGEHVGLREVARRAELGGQLVVERQVDVDALVARAVERAHRRRRAPAPALHRVAEEHEAAWGGTPARPGAAAPAPTSAARC
jgi:hypothetical protein